MSLNQCSIRDDYLRGVRELIGKNNLSSEMSDIINGTTIDDSCKAKSYYLLTRKLIDDMGSDKCELSDNFRIALAEAIGINLLDGDDFKANESIMPGNRLQRYLGGSLMNHIGDKATVYMVLTNPDAFSELLESIPYRNGRFLTYFNFMLDEAVKKREDIPGVVTTLGEIEYAMDCVDAIFRTSTLLRGAGRKAGKVLEKTRTAEGNIR